MATVDAAGLVSAVAGGEAAILIKLGDSGHEITVPVVVENYSPGPPIHFTNDVVPIFTKLGCNSGGCHGKSSGQNGFRLSLLGFEPELDYETLVREGPGPAAVSGRARAQPAADQGRGAGTSRWRQEDGGRLTRVPRDQAMGGQRHAQRRKRRGGGGAGRGVSRRAEHSPRARPSRCR